MWGAQGGDVTGYIGGRGSYVTGKTNFLKNKISYIHIGQKGMMSKEDRSDCADMKKSTIGGGGYTYDCYGAQGGGATDLRTVAGAWNNDSSLRSRIIVAAGGGGANLRLSGYGDGKGGGGGGITGLVGESTNVGSAGVNFGYCHGSGGTQISSLQPICQYGSNITSTNISGYAGGFGYGGSWQCGGGGGWYGGSGSEHGGAGGGSSYISGHAGAIAVTSSSSSSPKCSTGSSSVACSQSWTGYIFTSTQMIAGNAIMPNTAGTGNETGHSGDGYAKITWLGDTI